jgi:sulfite exporter TauE/SafE
LLGWGAGLHKGFKQHLFLAANILLLLMGISYLARAYLGR